MDKRKTAVDVLDKNSLKDLNEYIKLVGIGGYELSISNENVKIVGSGMFGDSKDWEYNAIPVKLTNGLTYADWIDLMMFISKKDFS